MKKLPLLISFVMAVAACWAQGYTYQPWQPSMGSLTFNTLGDAQHPYAQCKYGSSYNNPITVGVNSSNNVSSHEIITQNSDDPCRCYQEGDSYIHENYLPIDWNGTPDSHQDTAIRIGCGSSNSICNRAAQIEYWFYPVPDETTLMVMFSMAIQNVNTTHGVVMGCGSLRNPQFYIEVLDGETEQLLDLGYYPTQVSQQTTNPQPNYNWPFSKFLAWPSGCEVGSDSQNSPDAYGITTYYWAGQNSYGYATPTAFHYHTCPGNQTGGNSSSYPVTWFEYTPLAFNLKSIADQNVDVYGNFAPNKSVKLRIHTQGCSATAHWVYGLFTAQMISGRMKVESCIDQSVHLSVPWGFLEQTYEWHYGYDSVDAIHKIWDLSTPPVGVTPVGQNEVFLNPSQIQIYPYYRCEIKSHTGVPFAYQAFLCDANNNEYHLVPDFSYIQYYDNDEITIQLHDESLMYFVSPDYCPDNDTTYLNINNNHIQWYFKNGDYYQQFAVNNPDPVLSLNPEVIDGNGNVTVKSIVEAVVDGAYCFDSIEKVIPLSLVEIPEHSRIIFKVYPNPANEILNVQCTMYNEQIKNGVIQLEDEQGKLIRSAETRQGTSLQQTQINISDLAIGVYFVKWVSDGKTLAVRKVVKQ